MASHNILGMNSVQESSLSDYLQNNTLEIVKQIGFGIHGTVFRARRDGSTDVVIKVFSDELGYDRERDVYLRLQEGDIYKIGEFNVPELLNFDDDLKIIEMTLVPRPFALDFASAYLDGLPSYFPPFNAEWWANKEAQFGSENFEKVKDVLIELEVLGIYQTDVSPSNIALREPE